MADLERSNDEWDELWELVLAGVLSLARYLMHVRDRFRLARTIVHDFDYNQNTRAGATIVVTGTPLRGVNTDARLRLYMRITGAGPYVVSWYRATGGGGGDLVAQSAGTAAGADAAMVEQNDSGITGTYPLANPVTAENNDRHVLTLFRGWGAYLTERINYLPDTHGERAELLQSTTRVVNQIGAAMEQQVTRAVELLGFVLVGDAAIGNDRAFGAKFAKDRFTSLMIEAGEIDASGAVSQRKSGALFAFEAAMADETTGSTQTIVRRVVAAAAAVAESTNQGTMKIDAHTPEARCVVATYTLTCVAGLGTGDGGNEEFSLELAESGTDRTRLLPERLRIKRTYRGAFGFGGVAGITPLRIFSKTGDAGHADLADPTNAAWAAEGETEDNTASGDWWWEVTQVGAAFVYSFYKSALMAAGDLVAESSAVAANTNFTATPRNGSGLTINGRSGSGPTNNNTGQLHCNFNRVQNDSGVPDRYRIEVTLTSTGEISRVLAALPIRNGFGAQLNGAASGAERVSDNLVKANSYLDVHGEAA